ncbi:MAG: YgaP family membrane protein [Thiotrichales bacterium]
MSKNIGTIDRYARIAVGALLIIWALMGGPLWAWIGVVPLATALMGYCPAYSLLGMSTTKKDS